MADLITEVLTQLKPAMLELVGKTRVSFMGKFGHWVKSVHLAELEGIFTDCALLQLDMLLASMPEELTDLQQAYAMAERRLDTIGFEAMTIGKLDAKQFLRDEVAYAASYVPIVMATAVKVLLPLLAPGVGGIIATPLGAGLEFMLNRALGVK